MDWRKTEGRDRCVWLRRPGLLAVVAMLGLACGDDGDVSPAQAAVDHCRACGTPDVDGCNDAASCLTSGHVYCSEADALDWFRCVATTPCGDLRSYDARLAYWASCCAGTPSLCGGRI